MYNPSFVCSQSRLLAPSLQLIYIFLIFCNFLGLVALLIVFSFSLGDHVVSSTIYTFNKSPFCGRSGESPKFSFKASQVKWETGETERKFYFF